jgi:site-specific DNA-methyltransferase (adenine-specific)
MSLPTPYFDDGNGIVIYHGDCRSILPSIAAAAVDLVLTDPPYNVGIYYGGSVDDLRNDYNAWCRSWFAECRRIARRVALTPGVANLGLWHQIEQPTWVMAWHKPASMGRCIVGFNNWEPVLLYGSPARAVSDVVVAPVVPDRSVAGHPCPKPIRWARGLIAALSDEGQIILDPFMGSGTTLRAAKDLGRKAIGIEISEAYCEIAARRLQQEAMQFDTPEPTHQEQEAMPW